MEALVKILLLIIGALHKNAHCQVVSLFDYEDHFGAISTNQIFEVQPANSFVSSVKTSTPPVIPLAEIILVNRDKTSLFDNEPVAVQQKKANNKATRSKILPSRQPVPPLASRQSAPSIEERSESYGQFSTIRQQSGPKDTYQLHGQDPDGKNTQIIINLSNEPKSYVGYDGHKKEQNSQSDQNLLANGFIGPPAPPTGFPPAPPPVPIATPAPPATTTTTTAAPITQGYNNHGYPQYATPSQAPNLDPIYYGTPIAPVPPPQPQSEPTIAAPPQQAPVQSYGAPAQQAPVQSYGAPAQQAPVQSYGAPAQQAPVQSYGAPQAPPQQSDPIILQETQFMMPALTLSWAQPKIIQQQRAPPQKPSYNAPANNANDASSADYDDNDSRGQNDGVHYHVHVNDLDDVQQLDQIFQEQAPQGQQSPRPRPRQRPQSNPSGRHNYNNNRRPSDPRRNNRPQSDFLGLNTNGLNELLKLKCFIWCFFSQAEFDRNQRKK